MKAYESYKPSGVEWLGDLPEHWSVKNLKYVATYNDDVLPENTDADFEIEYIEISDVDEVSGIKNTEIMLLKDAPSRARRLVSEGDIIISTVRTYLRALAVINNPPDNMVVSTGFAVLRPAKINQRYARYAVSYDGFVQEVIARSNGVSYPAINASDLVRIAIPIPTNSEQQAIADYLDVETARIDGLIEAKHELINLLVEYRQSVISDAVLKGLDPDVPLKPSGVEWLGDVPAHWEMKKVKYLAELVSEKTDSPIAGQRYIGLEHVESKTGRFIENTEGMQTEAESTVNLFIKGCVLFGKLRPYLAKAVVADTDGVCSSEFLVFSPSGMDAQYLKRCMLLDGFIKTVDASTFGAKMPRADWTFISQLNLPQPPLDEQQAISRHLDVETSKFDSLISHAEKEIDLLKELRASTIADAVLGRVKVI